jgi:hypothetical protein
MSGIATYDGFDFAEEIATIEVHDPVKVMAADVPKRHGALIQDIPTRGAKRITFRGAIYGKEYDAEDPYAGLHTRINQYLAKQNTYNKQLRLQANRYFKAYPLGFSYEPREGSAFTVVDFVWDFICLDPFAYSDVADSETIELTSADSFADITNGFYMETKVVGNDGSLFVYPKVTVVCNSPSSKRWRIQFDNLTTGKSWTYEFDYPGGSVNRTVIVDASIFSVTIEGTDDLTAWTGTFVWLEPGDNSIRLVGSIDMTATIEWVPRYA